VVQTTLADEVPMLGSWKGSTFTPRVPFERGVTYRLTTAGFTTTFALPTIVSKPASVSAVYPAGNTLPANLLRFYLHFDRRMKPGQGYGHFALLDEHDSVLPFTFLELDEELWDEHDLRLTLLLDPGRVKRELVPRKELGPVLQAGKPYTLRIAREFQAKDGTPLAKEFRKPFRTGPALESGLDPAKWIITAPKAGTREPLSLSFPQAMDHALRRRAIALNIEGEPGTPDDTTWTWTPAKAWSAGRYELIVNDVLEDVCGNRIGAAFDVPLGPLGARQQKEPTRLAFDIR
jgi:hypothetical protein